MNQIYEVFLLLPHETLKCMLCISVTLQCCQTLLVQTPNSGASSILTFIVTNLTVLQGIFNMLYILALTSMFQELAADLQIMILGFCGRVLPWK